MQYHSYISRTVILLLVGTVTTLGTIVSCDNAASPVTDNIEQQPTSSSKQQLTSPSLKRQTIFNRVTESSGIEFTHHEYESEVQPIGAGVVIFDYNNDDFEDIYITDSIGPNSLFHNNGDGTFTDVAAKAGIDDPDGHSNGGCAADYDNDGDKDLYLTNYGTSKLFNNNNDGTFSNFTTIANLGDEDRSLRSAGCAWGDYDDDGYLDLIVVRHLKELNPDTLVNGDFYMAVGLIALYHSNGNGTFTNKAEILGDTGPRKKNLYGEAIGNLWGAGFQPGWIDYDEDGDLDLYVVNDWGPNVQPNVLWRNDGHSNETHWKFTDVSKESNAGQSIYGMSLTVGDYNLDGHMDIFMTNIGATVLLQNNIEDANFTDVANSAKVEMAKIGTEDRVTWGSAFFDYNNDGFEDLYIVSGYLRLPGVENVPRYLREQHNILLHNQGDGTFKNVSILSGADDSGVGRGLGYLDIENDGCLDLFVGNLGGKAALFRNQCESTNNWIVIKTDSSISNRDGIGTRITLRSGDKTQTRIISSGGSFMGHHMIPAHFGLGNSNIIEEITINWPSGNVQIMNNVKGNRRITITESE